MIWRFMSANFFPGLAFSKFVLSQILFSLICASVGLADQSVHLNWQGSSSPAVVGYNVYYGTESGVYSGMVSVTDTAADIGLTGGLTYYFVVTAYDSSGSESEPSNEASYVVPGIASPQGAPFVLQVLSDDSITLGWDPSQTDDVQGYYVYYGTQSGVYDNVVWVSGVNQLDIYYLLDGTTYYFAVTALDGSGVESAPTPEFSYTIAAIAPPQQAPVIQQLQPDLSLSVTWTPSPSSDVAGYVVYYGTESGVYDNYAYVGTDESFEVDQLEEGQIYFFTVVAYDWAGQLSDYSDESSYIVQAPIAVAPEFLLSMQPVTGTDFANAFLITATGQTPAAWTLQGSADLKNWHNLTTGTEPDVEVTVGVSEKPAMFFRLNTWFDGISLLTQTDPTNQFPNSFAVGTSDYVAWDWTLDSSEDLVNWNQAAAGFFSPVNLVVVSVPQRAMFFRLQGD